MKAKQQDPQAHPAEYCKHHTPASGDLWGTNCSFTLLEKARPILLAQSEVREAVKLLEVHTFRQQQGEGPYTLDL